eukprot:scaffold187067_cov45-Attheya_sp.AAC.1
MRTICTWLLQDGKSYNKILFAGKNKPKFPEGNCRWCPRCYHTKGFCFEDCSDKNNHTLSMNIPKEQHPVVRDYSGATRLAVRENYRLAGLGGVRGLGLARLHIRAGLGGGARITH